jgi:acetyl/propionyl-CoA carboxylase alpha subunit
VRIDSGVEEGDEAGSYYDPLLAKLIVHATTRAAALDLMQQDLLETALLGVTTNVDFLQDLLRHPAVERGELDTRFVEREFAWQLPELPTEVFAAAALAELSPSAVEVNAEEGADVYSPWVTASGFRLGSR